MRSRETGPFDRACDLLVAARRLSDELRRREAAGVLAPTFGCLEESLEELALGQVALRTRLDLEMTDPGRPAGPIVDALDVLQEALLTAARACAEARDASAGAAPSGHRRSVPSPREAQEARTERKLAALGG